MEINFEVSEFCGRSAFGVDSVPRASKVFRAHVIVGAMEAKGGSRGSHGTVSASMVMVLLGCVFRELWSKFTRCGWRGGGVVLADWHGNAGDHVCMYALRVSFWVVDERPGAGDLFVCMLRTNLSLKYSRCGWETYI